VIAQAPKLSPHIEAMRVNIAEDLKLPLDRVNVKAKTNEKLGYLGRAEGIEAQAAVLLIRK
jgi:2-C-methyl-D-erythritol 2,4-cyclodiphosphate synthase